MLKQFYYDATSDWFLNAKNEFEFPFRIFKFIVANFRINDNPTVVNYTSCNNFFFVLLD